MGVPRETIQYGRRVCHIVEKYKEPIEARRKRDSLISQGILAIIRKWYSWWVVYRCGPIKGLALGGKG